MKLVIENIRGINGIFELKNLNIFSGKNSIGKSTVLQIVHDMLVGKTTIKEGTAILEIDGKVINMNNGIIFNSPNINIRTLGFLSGKGKQIKGINSTKEDRRNTIFSLLGIEKFEGNIKGLTGQLRDLQTKESTLMDELMEKEELEIPFIEKPKEVKLINGTQGNQYELDLLQNRYRSIEIINLPDELPKPKEVILTTGNELELKQLKETLNDLKREGTNIPTVCGTCGQTIKDTEQMKQNLRKKYRVVLEKINNFKLIKSNQELYEKYKSDMEIYNQRIMQIRNIKSNNIDKQNEIDSINKAIKEFKLVTTTSGNEEEYKKYQTELGNYNANENARKIRLEDIKKLKEKIKAIPTTEIKSKIKKYRADELAFIKSVEDKLTIGDITIKVFNKLKTPNAVGEMYKSDFSILYKGKEYDELSSGLQVICDIIIENMFMKIDGSNILLIDNAEISNKNLKKVIKELKDIIILTTRITDSDLTLTHKL